MILSLLLGVFSEADSLLWAVMIAAQAQGAVVLPLRTLLPGQQGDVVQRTAFHAKAATVAGVSGMEVLRVHQPPPKGLTQQIGFRAGP